MFLSELTIPERKIFLDLAYLAMASDGSIDKSEENVYNTYKYECELTDFIPSDKSLDELLPKLKEALPQSKRIILMELCGIWSADDFWDDLEYKMMYKIAKSFGLSESEADRMKRWSREMKDLIHEGIRLAKGV